jgi:hypothetical protein
MNKRVWQTLYRNWSSRNSLWLIGIAIAGFLAYYWDSKAPREGKEPRDPQLLETASTMIPAGYVLVPIEVANYESLDSILGKHGVVDLYVGEDGTKTRQRKVAERIKILRAPLNPSHFAVLAPENESARIVSHQGPFTVVVQNPNRPSGTRFVNSPDESALSGRTKAKAGPHRSRIIVEVVNGNEN